MSREQISALMDGELDEARSKDLYPRMKASENWECWSAYHLIGDAMRNECLVQKGFSARFAERLAAEPTILSPGYRAGALEQARSFGSGLRGRRVQYALAASVVMAAVGLVGWFGLQEFTIGPGLNQMASSAVPRMGSAVSASSVEASRRMGGLGISPYLVVHQEYSPTTAMQGVRPYVRTVADMTVE